jgi:hypothetical protein
MPRGALRDLAIAVLRYDQAVRKVQKDTEHDTTTCVPDMDELYEEMLELAREGIRSSAEPRP